MLLFFGEAGCVQCHAVSGQSYEMFCDFREHVAGIPQIAPLDTNNDFDGAGTNEDFGLEQVIGDPADRYKFRTSPLRNVALQPTFMHNGAFTNLEDALRYHMDALTYGPLFTPESQGLGADLAGPTGPIEPVLVRLDPLLSTPPEPTERELQQLLAFVSRSLLDPKAEARHLRRFVPNLVPSGQSVLTFEFVGQ